jgi:serine/tyrosine/threonine adenylyltransferase
VPTPPPPSPPIALPRHLGQPFDNRFARELPMLAQPWLPQPAPAPRWLHFNQALAQQLGLDAERLAGDEGLAIFAGQALPLGAQPVAQAYAGHQFGSYSPRLGDGRALLLGEIVTPGGQRTDIAFKGSGRTPFARGGDGKAAVGPMLREVLISEAMHALGIPTTRSLAAVATGETVQREQPLPGAVLCRTAASHLRVGSFQYLAAQGQPDDLLRLLQHTVQRHCPEAALAERPALALLQAVVDRQAALVARWMGVGFIHGVMNTDNTTLSGETIDYGPCAFLEAHHPDTVFSSIDHQGRYAYGNQPGIAQWNLARLAEALLPLIDATPDTAVALATDAINAFAARYRQHWLAEQRAKLGLDAQGPEAADQALADDYLQLLARHQVDHTLGFRALSDALRGQPAALQGHFGHGTSELQPWLARWQQRLQAQAQPASAVAHAMDRHNPLVIPRNHRVEAALQAASDANDLAPFNALLHDITRPYSPPANPANAQPAPAHLTAGYRTFCGT